MLYCSFLRDECIIACIAWITDNKIILIAQGLKCSGHVLRVHDGPVTGLSLHATGDYVLTTSIDQHWTFSDINTGKLVSRVTDTSAPVPLTCAQVYLLKLKGDPEELC